MELQELKAKAYDTLAQIQFLQEQLGKLNQEIAIKDQESKAVATKSK
jgi:hypothetical protein